jgi:hypothetical protein
VEINHDNGMTLYAPSQDEKARVQKTKVMAQLVVANVDKAG